MRAARQLSLVEGNEQVLDVRGGQVIAVLVGRKQGQRVDGSSGGAQALGTPRHEALGGGIRRGRLQLLEDGVRPLEELLQWKLLQQEARCGGL